jgi:hypothetical protein
MDIASRLDSKEWLGLAVDYAVHPSGVGCFILRFVVHGEGVSPVTKLVHFTFREKAKFVSFGPGMHTMIKGIRVNKVAIPVFAPAIQKYEIEKYAEQFGIWAPITEWVAEQAKADGFELTVDLVKALPALLLGPVTEGDVKCIMEFPDLQGPEQQMASKHMMQKPEPDDDPDADEEDEDEDTKDWLN